MAFVFQMPRGIPTQGGEVVLHPGDTFYRIPGARRLLAVKRGGVVVGYTSVRTVLYGMDYATLTQPNAPTDDRGNFIGVDTIEGAARRGLGSWPSL